MVEQNRKMDTIRVPKQEPKKVENKAEPLLSILEPVEQKPKQVETKPVEAQTVVEPLKPAPNVKVSSKKEKPVESKKKMKTHHKIAAWVVALFAVFFIVLSVAGAAYAHQSIYANKVYPGVVVWGEDVGGKTMEQVQALVTEKIKNFKLTVDGPDQNYAATAEDLGIIFNSESMALSAYSKGRTGSFWDNYLTRAKLLGTRVDWQKSKEFFQAGELEISPSYTVDDQILNEYIKKISNNINITAKDSQVKVENGAIKMIPAVYGRQVMADSLKSGLLESINRLNSGKVRIQTQTVTPKIIDNSAQEVMVQANDVMNRPIVLTYKEQSFSPNKETVASWLTFVKPAGAQNYELVVDTSLMKKYMSFLGSELNINPVPKRVQVKNGAEQTVTQEGKDGLLIDEVALSRQIAAALPNQPNVTLPIPMYVAKFKTEYRQVLVANWEKYIDIDLSTQTLTAYLKGGKVVGSWKVTTGNRYHPTPVGTWLVHGKSAITRMTGGTRGIDYYDLPNVHWVTWFKGGGYSIHEAYWRSTFGSSDYLWNGSHGCVNAPLSLAHFIYDWAPIGTPVVIHY